MTPHDTDPLERLAPALPWAPDWRDVVARARRPDRARAALKKRRLVLALALVGAVAAPFVAYGAANDWWFLSSGASPTPANAPVVVTEGDWSGHAWQLVAYPSTTDGLCFGVTPKSSEGTEGAGIACAPIAGVARAGETKATPDMTITYLMAGSSGAFPAYVVGPVVDRAAQVEIRFATGRAIQLPTFAGAPLLGRVRFYATALPANVRVGPRPGGGELVDRLRGLDSNGAVVACLVPATADDGISPLSDCR
jgi:hypothetical protein